jgi:hypothetical protein
MHCDRCGLTWVDDGLNPLFCPYCKLAAVQAATRYQVSQCFCANCNGAPHFEAEPDGDYVRWADIEAALKERP